MTLTFRTRRSSNVRPAGDDRPVRPYGDRPARSFDDGPRGDYRPARDDRPTRSYSDRPARSFDDRPRRDFSDRPRRDAGPNRSDWKSETASKAHEQHVDVVHEKLQAEAVQTQETSDVTFTSQIGRAHV